MVNDIPCLWKFGKGKSARSNVLFNGRVSVSRNFNYLNSVNKSVSRVNRIKHTLFKNKFYTLTLLPVKQPGVVKKKTYKSWIRKRPLKPVYVPDCGPEPPVLKTVYPCTQLEFTQFIDLQSASKCHKAELSGVSFEESLDSSEESLDSFQESLDTHQNLCLNDFERDDINLTCKSHVPEYKNVIYECSCGCVCDASTVFAHVKTVHNFLICLYCLELFENAKLLAFHLVNDHNSEETDYSSLEETIPCDKNVIFHFVCSSCEKTFNDKTEYLSHRCEKSSAIAQAVCENCNHHLETCNCGLFQENLSKENTFDTNSNMEHSQELLNTQNKNPKNNETISHCSKQNVETLVENHNDKEFIQPSNKYCKAGYDHQLTGEQKSVQNTKERLHSEIQGDTGMENMSKNRKSMPNKMTGKLIKKKNLRGKRNISIKKAKKVKLKTAKKYNKETLSKGDSKKVHNNKLMLENINKNFSRNESNYEPLRKGQKRRSNSSTIYNNVFENELIEQPQSSKSSVENISDSGKSSYITTVPSLVPSPRKLHHVNKNMMNSDCTSLNVSAEIYDFDSSQPNHTESTSTDSSVSLEHLSENVPALHENHINDNFLGGNVTQVDELLNISDIKPEVSDIAIYNNEVRNGFNVNNHSSDAELINEEEPPFELSFGVPIDAIPTLKLLKECVKVASSVCFYCKHADNLLVNCRQLMLHIMLNHKFEININLDNGIHEKCDDLLPRLIDEMEEISHVFFYSDEFEQKSFNNLYECFHCHYASVSIKELYEHVRYFHEFNYFKCIWCQNYFYNYADLICHLCAGKYIPDTRIFFRCIVCSLENISSEYKLTQHLRENHHVCNVCLKESDNQVSLIKHIYMHIGTCLNHFCSKCNIPYNHESEMREHVISAHNKNEPRKKSNPKWPDICICNICRAVFPNKNILKVHKASHSIHAPTESGISAHRDSDIGDIRLQGINIQTVANKRSESYASMSQLCLENPPITNDCEISVERKGNDSEESAYESDPMNICGPSSKVASNVKENVNKSNLNRLVAPKVAQFGKLKKCLSSETSQENNTVENQVIESVHENSHYVETLQNRNIIEVRDLNEANSKHNYSVETPEKETSEINKAQILNLKHDMPETFQSITDFSDSQNSSSLDSLVSYQLGNAENILLTPSDEGTSKALSSAENVSETSSSSETSKFDNMMQPEHGECRKRRQSTAHIIEITEIPRDEYSSEDLNDDDSEVSDDTLVEELKTPLNISSGSIESKVKRRKVTKRKAAVKKTLKNLDEERNGMGISFSETDDSVFVDAVNVHTAEINNSLNVDEELSADYAEESDDGKIYCYCRSPYDYNSKMIGCDGKNCKIEWFHYKCLGITAAPRGKWYCPECKESRK